MSIGADIDTGAILRRERARKGLTISGAALLSGLSRTDISQLETNKLQPAREQVVALARAYDRDALALAAELGIPKPPPPRRPYYRRGDTA